MATQTHRRHKQALIVEDDLVFAGQLKSIFQHLKDPWDIHCSHSGYEAIELFEKNNHFLDLALVDMGLPDISGLEVIRHLNKRLPFMPIIVVSVLSLERSVIEAIRAGARGYLLKDDPATCIAESVEDVLNGNYPISPSLARYLFKLAGSPQATTLDPLAIDLTAKERETLEHIAQGLTYRETADRMTVSLSTIQTHIRALYGKLNAHSQVQALNRAKQLGLI